MWFLSSRKTRRPAKAPSRRSSHRPRLEQLEDRCVPSSAGFLDSSFGAPNGYVVSNPNPSRQANGGAIVVQSDGKIVVAGKAANPKNGYDSLAVLRYNADGTLDNTFGSGGIVLTTLTKLQYSAAYSTGVALQSDGKIVVAGYQLLSATPVGTTYDREWVLARYNANGTLDTTFGGGHHPTGIVEMNLTAGDDQTSGLQIQPWDGKIIVVGHTQTGIATIARFNTNGTPDSTFGSVGFVYCGTPGAIDGENALALQPLDHKIVVVGVTGPQLLVLRYNSDGSPDTSFNGTGILATGPLDGAGGIVLQSDGSIVVAGRASGQAAMTRITSTGAVDTSFGSNGTFLISGLSYLTGLAIHPNTGGEFDVAGGLVTPNYDWPGAVARVQANGSLDTSFGANAGLSSYLTPPPQTYVLQFNAMALQSDGNIVVTGNIPTASQNYNVLVARYYGATSAQAASFAASPNPTAQGASLSLTASDVVDLNPNSNISQVTFNLDSNRNRKLAPGSDSFAGYATQASAGSVDSVMHSQPGAWHVHALRSDGNNYDLDSDPFALTLIVQ